MAKVKTAPYGLKAGHEMEFRRTIKTARKPYQLVFQPGKPLELNDQEVAYLEPELACGLIVPWQSPEADHRSRVRPPKPIVEAVSDASDEGDVEIVDDEALLGDEV